MKFIIIAITLLVTASNLSSQTYDGQIILENRKKIEAQSITINDNDITFLKRNDNKLTHIDKSEVRMLRVEDGNYAFEGLFMGAAVGFAVYIGSINFNEITSDGSLYSLGIGGFFGFIGGLTTSRIRSIRVDNNNTISLFDNINYIPNTKNTNITILKYQYTF